MEMNNVLVSKIPVEPIKDGIRTVNNAKKKVYTLEKEKEALDLMKIEEIIKKYGETGVNERKKKAEEIDSKIAVIRSETLEVLSKHREKAVSEVDAQFTPDGNDIIGANAADIALIQNDIITTPDNLKRLLQRHNNTAFRMLAARYAKKHDWSDFEYIDKEQSIRGYVEQVFNNLETAAYMPLGIAGTQYTGTIGEYRRIAESYELSEEFHASNGNSIDEVIVTIESLA